METWILNLRLTDGLIMFSNMSTYGIILCFNILNGRAVQKTMMLQ